MNSKHVANSLIVVCLICLVIWWRWPAAAPAEKIPSKQSRPTTTRPSSRQARISPDGRAQSASLTTAVAAKSRAIALTGFQAGVESVEETVLSDSNIPFLSGAVIGRPAWVVKFSPFMLNLKSEKPGTDRYQRDFEVILDKETGQLISINSRFSGTMPAGQTLLPPPTHLEAESQLRGGRIYAGFPVADPVLSFIEALDTIEKRAGIEHPYQAIELSAIYVNVPFSGSVPPELINYETGVLGDIKDDNRQLQSVWVIGLRGVPPGMLGVGGPPTGELLRPGRPTPPGKLETGAPATRNPASTNSKKSTAELRGAVDGLGYLTIMVDGTSGKILSTSTRPRPISSPK
jgi:hypothetical protein